MDYVDEVLRATAQAEPGRAAYIDESSPETGSGSRDGHRPAITTYGALDAHADAWAAALLDIGVRPGDVVFQLLAPTVAYPTCYMGNARAGAITSGANIRLGPGEIGSIVARTAPAVSVLEDGASPPPGSGHIVWRSDLERIFASGRVPMPAPRRPDDLVAIVWTSGTTGLPKGAMFSHANIRVVAESDRLLTARHDRYLSAIPHAHVGFMTKIRAQIAAATTQVIAPGRWTADGSLRLLERHHITVAGGVPAQWRMMLDHPAFDTTDLSAVRQVALGGAFIEPSLVAEIRARVGAPVLARYTCTEAAITSSTRPDDPDDIVAKTVGKPLPGVEVAIRGKDASEVPAGVVGEICCRSNAVMSGYWQDPDRTSEVLDPDGWLHTGDLGRFDEDGNIQIVGRRKDMYIRGGYNVYPAEIEGRLAAHPRVAQVAVVGRRHDRLGEIGVAFVVPVDPSHPPSSEELRQWCKEWLADYKRPDEVIHVDSLPLTAVHKVDKQALAARLDTR